MKKDIDYTQQFAALEVPTLIVAADADMFPPSHAVEMFALLDGGKRDGGWDGAGQSKRGQLAILPGATHYNSFASPALAVVAAQFLGDSVTR
jgi:pimeloyl-ACP methyl ester carboxylesterase